MEKKEKSQKQSKKIKILQHLTSHTKTQDGECGERRGWKSFFFLSVESARERTERDWMIVFVVILLLLILILFMSWSTFSSVYRVDERAASGEGNVSERTVDRALLKEVLGAYDKKEQAFQSLEENTPSIIDPSL